MSNDPKENDLLRDVLDEEVPPDFRAALLSATLRGARRRRSVRLARDTVGILALVCVVGFMAWYHLRSKNIAARQSHHGYHLVNTQPLPGAAIVRTHSLNIDRRVVSVTVASVVRSTSSTFRMIDDNQLLALLAPRPVVLVSVGHNSKKLVFANDADEESVRLN
jgi:hypothetical protein